MLRTRVNYAGSSQLHFAGAPGELQEQLPGGGDCFADGALSKAKHHLPAENGQQRGRDDDDGFEDFGQPGDEGYLQPGSPEKAVENRIGIAGSHFDEPLAFADGELSAAGVRHADIHYGEARLLPLTPENSYSLSC